MLYRIVFESDASLRGIESHDHQKTHQDRIRPLASGILLVINFLSQLASDNMGEKSFIESRATTDRGTPPSIIHLKPCNEYEESNCCHIVHSTICYHRLSLAILHLDLNEEEKKQMTTTFCEQAIMSELGSLGVRSEKEKALHTPEPALDVNDAV